MKRPLWLPSGLSERDLTAVGSSILAIFPKLRSRSPSIGSSIATSEARASSIFGVERAKRRDVPHYTKKRATLGKVTGFLKLASGDVCWPAWSMSTAAQWLFEHDRPRFSSTVQA